MIICFICIKTHVLAMKVEGIFKKRDDKKKEGEG